MPQKKRTETKRLSISGRNTNHKKNWKKIVLWCTAALILIIFGAIAWCQIAKNMDKTKIIVNATQPAVATFSDTNTMYFAVPGAVPDINNDRHLSAPDDVIVSYTSESDKYTPAFRTGLTDNELTQSIKITPFVRGTFHMAGDSAIVFSPDSPWPADEKFTIKISPEIFNPDVRPNSKRVSFKTPEITAKVDNFNLYNAPDAKQSLVGVAVISFDYAIDTTDFNNKVSLRLDNERLNFSVRFDKFNRTAIITSEPVHVSDTARVMRLKLDRIPAMSGHGKTEKLNANITVESADNIFKISSISTTTATDTDGNAQQLILLETTAAAADNTHWDEYLDVYLLPAYHTPDEQKMRRAHTWAADEITDEVLSQSEKLSITRADITAPNGVYQYAFYYNVSDDNVRYIYVSVNGGAVSANGFTMNNGATQVMRVPYPAESVSIAGTGALLSFTGDRNLGIVARGGVNTAYVNLYKIKSDEINHLISQTYNIFAPNIEFKSWAFGVYDMAIVFQKRIAFSDTSKLHTNYASVDLGEYLNRTDGDNTGIFIIQTGASANSAEFNDKRLILLTDLGIIRKKNSDESSSLFVSNLSDGNPAGNIDVYVLGRNGTPVWTGRTNTDGRVNIPQLAWSEYRNAREPVAIVARRGNDVSFIPYNAYAQRVEYSKYDVDGTYSSATNPLNAFVFSDRGIYRPGEEIILAGIVKNTTFKSVSGIPVKMVINDSRGRIAQEKTFSLASDGMFDIHHEIADDAPLGTWFAYLYSLDSNNNLGDMLGMTSFDVQEFTPDTMKITANISGMVDNGWIGTNDISANVSLRNLFGTPAASRRITASATLRPTEYSFANYPEYKFTPNYISGTGLSNNTAQRTQTYSVELPDTTTDENGMAVLNIDFNRNIPHGTYTLILNVRGFEANSGRSVQTNITARVSDLQYLVGWRSTSDLAYIKQNAPRTVQLVALDSLGAPINATGLKMRVMQREHTTTLVKDYNNYYKYQTTTRNKLVSQSDLTISATGTEIKLDTTSGGTYFVQILDSDDNILANIEYFVAGGGNVLMETDTAADLQIKLNTTEYKPGDKIEVSITAPYTGAGLITIERDKVYAYKWFKTNSTSSVQYITLPDNFTGTGYVNVSFVRDINSRDIFTSPYAYAVAPFETDATAHEIDVHLDVPKVIRDNLLVINYTSNKNARMMLFAIDSGILQVAKYQIPNPLAHFFQKAALQVDTFQILSLLLPEYNILRQFAKTGGGDYSGADGGINQILTNPFSRKNSAPVAFYSGIIDANANETGTVKFEIPEYFNGEIHIFAVAARNDAIGAADTTTLVQSPIIISTTAPLAVAPLDSFDINTVITNMTSNSGNTASVNINIATNNLLEITSADEYTSTVAENADKLFTFNTRATNKIGNAEITLNTTLTHNDSELAARRAQSNISVRPATTYETRVKSGTINSADTAIRKFSFETYPEYSVRRLYISRSASALIMPLFAYLEKYEYPCTEQLVSRTMPYALMPNDELLGTNFDKSAEKIASTINLLRNRQNADGSFALWASSDNQYARQNNNARTAYLTAYVAHFLTIARDSGFIIPTQMLSRAIDYLRTFAGTTITNASDAAATAYAIYVITANGYVTTSYIDMFTEYARANIKNWESDLMGAYIAASYKILHQDDLARTLIDKYTETQNDEFEYVSMFDNNIANDAMYYYLVNQHFDSTPASRATAIQRYISSGDYSAYTSAAVIMALSGNSAPSNDIQNTLSIMADDKNLTTRNIGTSMIADIPADIKHIEIKCPECTNTNTLFYALIQQGYPLESTPESNGIEIVREYYNANGDRITRGNIGDTITVRISARTRGDTATSNVVITDLLPGGFIPDTQSATGAPEFIEMRTDRVLIYTDLTRTDSVFTYSVQLGSSGEFTVPAIHAESMYNPQINATGKSGTFTVSNDSAN